MRFSASPRRWWTRSPMPHEFSLNGRWVPLVALGGLLAAMIFPAWRFGPAAKGAPTATGAIDSASLGDFHQLPAIQIRLGADASSRLASIALDGKPVKDLAELRARIAAIVGPAADATLEAELDCDGQLRYEQTLQVIAAISARPSTDGRTMLPMVDRIKFAPRRK